MLSLGSRMRRSPGCQIDFEWYKIIELLFSRIDVRERAKGYEFLMKIRNVGFLSQINQ
jgi:hypothetical protein